MLAKEGLKEKLSAVLLHAYHQNCITIFREDIIDFDQKTKDYVIEQCKGAQQKPV